MAGVRRWVPVLVVAMLAASACGGDPARESARPLADLVPRDAHVYAEGTVRLGSRAGRDAGRFVEGLTGVTSVPEGAIVDLLAQEVDMDVDFDELKPWLGDRAALFLIEQKADPHAAGVVVEVTDVDRARRFLHRKLGRDAPVMSHRGVRFRSVGGRFAAAIVDGRAVVGTSAAVVEAAIDARRAPLSSTPRFKRAVEGDEPPFLLAIATPKVLTGFMLMSALSAAEERMLDSVLQPGADFVMRASLDERRALMTFGGLRGASEPAVSIADLPGDSLLALGSADLATILAPVAGESLTPSFFLDAALGARFPREVLRATRRGTFFVQPQSDGPSGELFVTVAGRHDVARELLAFAGRLRRARTHNVEVRRWRTEVSLELWPRDLGTHYSVRVDFRDDDLNVEFGGGGPSDPLSGTAAYRRAERALGHPPTAMVDMRELARLLGPAAPQELGALERVAFIAGAERSAGGQHWQDVLIELRPAKPQAPSGERSWLPAVGAVSR
jgi:hypothetical protein